MSSYNDVDLFGSGPHRFVQGPLGTYLLRKARVDPFQAGSEAIGPLEETVTVRGRLVAADAGGLASLVDAIRAEITDPPTVARLTDDRGGEWEDMSLTHFEPLGAAQHGRVASLEYEAHFIRLATAP